MALRKGWTGQNKQQFTCDRLRLASDVGVKAGRQQDIGPLALTVHQWPLPVSRSWAKLAAPGDVNGVFTAATPPSRTVRRVCLRPSEGKQSEATPNGDLLHQNTKRASPVTPSWPLVFSFPNYRRFNVHIFQFPSLKILQSLSSQAAFHMCLLTQSY